MDKIDELLTRSVDKILPSKEKLESELRSGKRLRVYQGFDPTSPNLHIGHLAGLRKLRQWQDLGHEVIFLIGDFTAAVGDPTGKDKTRPMLSEKEIIANAKTYQEQASKVLNFTGLNPVRIRKNSEWLAKLSAIEVARLASYLTVQQVIERDMFQKRLQQGSDVAISEFFYPFMQGYDSVAMDVDVEVGGSDQLFNMLTGRDLMHKIKRKNKYVMTTALITDSQGKKLGKSEGNAIGIILPPKELFGMIMSLEDAIIVNCFESITTMPLSEVYKVQDRLDSGENPMILKKQLAHQIVTELHSQKDADQAQKHFESAFQSDKSSPSTLPTEEIKLSPGKNNLIDILVENQIVGSKSEAKRLLDQKAIELNGETIVNRGETKIKVGDILIVGKRKFLKFT